MKMKMKYSLKVESSHPDVDEPEVHTESLEGAKHMARVLVYRVAKARNILGLHVVQRAIDGLVAALCRGDANPIGEGWILDDHIVVCCEEVEDV